MSIMDAIMANAMGGGLPHIKLTTPLAMGQAIKLSDGENAALTAALNQATSAVISASTNDGMVITGVFSAVTFADVPGGSFTWSSVGMMIQITDESGTGKWNAVYVEGM